MHFIDEVFFPFLSSAVTRWGRLLVSLECKHEINELFYLDWITSCKIIETHKIPLCSLPQRYLLTVTSEEN